MGTASQGHPGALIPIDHPELDLLYHTAARLRVPVLFHAADPQAFFDPLDERNERAEELALSPDWSFADCCRFPPWWQLVRRIEKVLTRHPDCRTVGVHFGCAAEEPNWVADVLRDHPGYYVDIAARIGELGRHRAAEVRRIFAEQQDRILFGTDLGVREQIMLGALRRPSAPTLDHVERFYQAHRRWLQTGDCAVPHPTAIQGRWAVDAIELPVNALAKLYGGNARNVFGSIGAVKPP